MNPKAFLSYSLKDSQAARNIYDDLVEQHIKVWVDFVDLDRVATWEGQIRRAIADSAVFVWIMSSNSVIEPRALGQLKYAERHRSLIVPLMIEPVAHPPELKCYRLFDVATSPESYEEFIEQVRVLTSSQFLRTRRRIFEPTITPTLETISYTANASLNLARYIRRMLESADPPIARKALDAYLADALDISILFAQSLLHGTFPIQELDDDFLEDLAGILHTSIEDIYAVLSTAMPINFASDTPREETTN